MNTQRETIEAELRCLHSSLDASSCTFGDWRMSKATENLITEMATCEEPEMLAKLKAWFTTINTDLATVLAQRATTRARINELEEQLENLPDDEPIELETEAETEEESEEV